MPTVGRNEDTIRSYIRQQEKKDARLDQLNLWCRDHLQVAPKSGPAQRPRTAASSGSPRNAPGFAGGYLLWLYSSILYNGGFYHEARIPNLSKGLHLGAPFGPATSGADSNGGYGKWWV